VANQRTEGGDQSGKGQRAGGAGELVNWAIGQIANWAIGPLVG
jgi:hypothetical protein